MTDFNSWHIFYHCAGIQWYDTVAQQLFQRIIWNYWSSFGTWRRSKCKNCFWL